MMLTSFHSNLYSFQVNARRSGVSDELSSEEDTDAVSQNILLRRSVEGAPSENQSRKPSVTTSVSPNQSVSQVSYSFCNSDCCFREVITPLPQTRVGCHLCSEAARK